MIPPLLANCRPPIQEVPTVPPRKTRRRSFSFPLSSPLQERFSYENPSDQRALSKGILYATIVRSWNLAYPEMAIPEIIMNDAERIFHYRTNPNALADFLEEHPYIKERLTILHLSSCKLKELPQELGLLENLTDLNVSNNLLEEVNSEIIASLRNLKMLALHNNRIKSLSPTLLYPFTRLEILMLHCNELQSLPLALFHRSKNLKRLYLHQNPLKIPKGVFIPLKALELLYLPVCRFIPPNREVIIRQFPSTPLI